MSEVQPRRFGSAVNRIVSLVPNLFLTKPEKMLDKAPPIDIEATAQENSFSVITNWCLELRIVGPAGADHPKASPNMKRPPLAVKESWQKWSEIVWRAQPAIAVNSCGKTLKSFIWKFFHCFVEWVAQLRFKIRMNIAGKKMIFFYLLMITRM